MEIKQHESPQDMSFWVAKADEHNACQNSEMFSIKSVKTMKKNKTVYFLDDI